MPTRRRLDSWKDIAAHLNRDVRTAQRWHASAGLPVHRVGDARLRSVFAYADELDQWYQTGPSTGSAEGASAAPTRRQSFTAIFATLSAALLLAVLWVASTAPGTRAGADATHLAAAQMLANRGDWAAAARVLDAAVEREPEDALLLVWLATAVANSGASLERVPALVARARRQRPNGSDETRSFLDAASLALLGHTPSDAIDAFNAHLASYPRDIWSRRFLASLLLKAHRAPESVAQYVRTAGLQPNDFRSQADAAASLATWTAEVDGARSYVSRARRLLSSDPAEQRPNDVAFVLMFPVYDRWRNGEVALAAANLDGAWASLSKRSPAMRAAGATMAESLALSLGMARKARFIVESIEDPHQRHAELSRIAGMQGNIDEMRRLLALVPPTSARAGLFQYAKASPERAREAFDLCARQAIPAPTAAEFDLIVALAERRDLEVVDLAKRVYPQWFATDAPELLDDVSLAEGVAASMVRVGYSEDAIRLLELATRRVPGFNPHGVDGLGWLEAKLTLRDAYAANGRHARAADLTQEVARRFALADADLPARRRLATSTSVPTR